MNPFTKVQTNILMMFLDRVPTTGHRERQAMNEICSILVNLAKDVQPEVDTKHPNKDKDIEGR